MSIDGVGPDERRDPTDRPAPRPVVEHELLHALGFGHARGWSSALAPAGATSAGAPTAADVAYGQLHEALRRQAGRAEAEYGGAYGWAEAGP